MAVHVGRGQKGGVYMGGWGGGGVMIKNSVEKRTIVAAAVSRFWAARLYRGEADASEGNRLFPSHEPSSKLLGCQDSRERLGFTLQDDLSSAPRPIWMRPPRPETPFQARYSDTLSCSCNGN